MNGPSSFSELLYPMLSEQPRAAPAVVEELAAAPLEKSQESSRLRELLLAEQGQEIVDCALEIADSLLAGGRVLTCGNGGSATSAADIVASLMASQPGPALPALCLTNDVAVVTAIGNDVSFDDVFSRQVIALGRPDDVVVAVSTSGSSENLVRAVRCAHERGMLTVALCGYDGGRMRTEATVDHCFVVRSSSVHRIQEVQSTLYHLLVDTVQRRVREIRACA